MESTSLTMEDIVVEPPGLEAVVDPVAYFDSPGPVELEIGCGKGGFLLRRALERPELRLLGIEWANKIFRYTADRMARRGAWNVRVMRTDADHFVKRQLRGASLSALHIYHPDPWPKKRHHKRRLIQAEFVAAAVRAMRLGARLAIQTDHADYAEQIQAVVSENRQLRTTDYEDAAFGTLEAATGTNYEIKYVREGRKIYRFAYIRVE
jgi:tRNA (guanine-N7-)-methyltransferase